MNFRRTAVGARMAKFGGDVVVGTMDGVFKTRTVQRKAYEHRWRKEKLNGEISSGSRRGTPRGGSTTLGRS